MTSMTRSWIRSSAASHEIGSNAPEPFDPRRRMGRASRPVPCTKSTVWRATLLQMTPAVNGNPSEPRTLTMRSVSTVTVRLQVSGQSRVQTLARSWRVMGVPKTFQVCGCDGGRSQDSLYRVQLSRNSRRCRQGCGQESRRGRVGTPPCELGRDLPLRCRRHRAARSNGPEQVYPQAGLVDQVTMATFMTEADFARA